MTDSRVRIFRPSRDLVLSIEGLGPQIALAAGLTVAAGLARLLLGMIDPNVVPSAVYFPAIVASALLGGWRAGGLTLAMCFAANYGLFGDALASHTARRPLNIALFFLLCSGSVAVCQWLGTLVLSLQHSRERLAQRNLNYDILFETITEGFAVCQAIRDPSGRLIDYQVREMNPALRRVLGLTPEQALGKMSDAPGDWPEWLALCERVLATGRPAAFETRYAADNRWWEIRVSRVTSETMAQLFIDITDRKTEQQRQAALFDELNHRVKNNLAIVSSVLTMQARGAEPATAEALRTAVSRVHSIADLHASLYRSHRSEAVDVGLYLQELGGNLSKSLLDEAEGVTIRVEAPSATMAAEHAVPLGLVVSELVTNAVKHAYPHGHGGEIVIALERRDGADMLTVADFGRGLPEMTDDTAAGLGMHLVHLMVSQLGGELTISREGGARFEIRLPEGSLA
ncbi:MAG TPA: histidine kinase dimerization/phosphoacceptor domain -containing protein [Caulobacteraceae bacterium]|nr:histidine kinase dimerization/phosphoacceptor domain -containing protein [Caulobacteraceae bacterium]